VQEEVRWNFLSFAITSGVTEPKLQIGITTTIIIGIWYVQNQIVTIESVDYWQNTRKMAAYGSYWMKRDPFDNLIYFNRQA
jgi:hypothetical protein